MTAPDPPGPDAPDAPQLREASRISLEWDERGGVSLWVDGWPQSHVQPDDATVLAFEYIQHLALAIDTCLSPAPARVAVTHVGGAAMTLARYVEATRPGSPQVVLEPDAALTALVRERIPLPRRHRIRVRPQDGLTGVRALGTRSADVVVTDAYARGQVPAELSSAAYVHEVARVLKPHGAALWNLADEPGMRWVARMLATILEDLPYAALIATHEVLKGRRFGNSVAVASHSPLPEAEIRRAVARSNVPTGIRMGDKLDRLLAGAKPFGDKGVESPTPPEARGWRIV